MNRHPYRSLFFPLALGAIGCICACNSNHNRVNLQDKPRKIRLTFPHTLNQQHPVHKAIIHFAEETHRLTHGEVEVRVYEGNTIGNEKDIADEVAAGNYDMTKVSSTILADDVELARIFSLPYLFRDREHMWSVLDGQLGREMLDMGRTVGLRGLCYYDAGFRSFYCRDYAVTKPSDLDGVPIRVQRSPIMARLVEIFGGRPVPISFSDVVAALDDGRVLCAENNIPTYYSERHYEKAPFFSFDEHVAIPDIVLISEQTWSKLRPDIQRALAEAAAESSRYQRGIWELSEREAMDAMREAGVTFEYPSKQPFVDKAMPIYAEIGEERLRGYIERIRREGAPATAQTPAIDPAVSTASTEVSQAK